nr:hypothetical protein [uncultured Mediterranean phage uvMED]
MPHADPAARKEYQRQYNLKNRERRRLNKWRSDQKLMAEKVARNKERYHSDPEARLKRKARNLINIRIAKGQWPRASVFTCTDCNAPAREYHHENYEQWWSIEPLCRSCHVIRHDHQPG